MNKGFIALTLVLSVSGILLGLTYATALEYGLFFDQAMRKEYRVMNNYYALDCIDQAILYLAHDYFFATTTPIEIEGYNCSILSVIKDGELRFISARGNFQKAFVYRHAIVHLRIHDLDVIKIE